MKEQKFKIGDKVITLPDQEPGEIIATGKFRLSYDKSMHTIYNVKTETKVSQNIA